MGIIKILDENLSNLIAAGEVVENPSSLVKELIENSLDAGSTYIKIEVNNGGKNLKIIDNGKGMSKEDLLLCIERHATSKITSKDDLFNLSTYGFRGEALSSIAAVSKMTISSRELNAEIGHFISVSAGKITNIKECQKSIGTEITIKDLFFNTPARLKFLRKNSTEYSKIKEIIIQESLANPNISIVLSIEGKESVRTSGKGLENTIIDLFGLSVLKNLTPIQYGFIGNLSLIKSTKDYIFTFVNKRPVKAKVINEAIIDGFYTKLMKGKYPFAIINYDINPNEVDVNVHPSKKLVKFSNEQDIYDKIYNEIISKLNFDKDFTSYQYEVKSDESKNNFFNFNETNQISEQKSFLDDSFDTNFLDAKVETSTTSSLSFNKELELEKDITSDIFTLDDILNISPTKKMKENIEQREETSKKLSHLDNIKIIGQFCNSFIITEENNNLVLYDQHIVHERILYEKLKRQYSNKKINSQKLLVPIKITLNSKEQDIFKEKIEYFENFGFEIDEFNNNEFLIRSVPAIEFKDSFENIFFTILEGIKKFNSKNEVIESMIISMSCKGAIKINEKLSICEMEKIIAELHSIGNFTCPHGRPIIFKISKHEIEKGFKRK